SGTLAQVLANGNTAGGTALLAAVGTAALPGLAFEGFPDDGIIHEADGEIGVSIGGTRVVRFRSFGVDVERSGGKIINLNNTYFESDVLESGTVIRLSRAKGTLASPGNVIDGTELGTIQFEGNVSGFKRASVIMAQTDGTPSVSSMPGRLMFRTTPVGNNGASLGVEALRINSSQQTLLIAGTAALPALAHILDPDSGRFNPSANVLAWATGGAEGMRLNAAGQLLIGATSSTASELLHVAGAVVIAGKLTVGGVIDPTQLLLTGADKKLGATDAGPLYLAPFADSTTAIQVRKADDTTVVATFDTINSWLGIGIVPTVALDIVPSSLMAQKTGEPPTPERTWP
ncbi:hypothetical protein LCGC14_2992800, partial [marine sediment metagenome]